jgi:hypothetical protein
MPKWLPQSACAAFENAFGLTYNASTNYYLVNDSMHALLKQRNASVKFVISAEANPGSGYDTGVTLSYDAFDLTLDLPIVTNSTRYFPLRQAMNTTQYTLGRAFLQEAYVIADYDRGTFNVSQAVFDGTASRVFTITPPSNSTKSTNATASGSTASSAATTSSGLSAGTWAGIAIAVATAVVLAYLGIAWTMKKPPFRQRNKDALDSTEFNGKAELPGNTKPLAEAPQTSEIKEMPAHAKLAEAEAKGIGAHEMPADVPPQEMSAKSPVAYEMPARSPGAYEMLAEVPAQ